jgi:hypothetical protein
MNNSRRFFKHCSKYEIVEDDEHENIFHILFSEVNSIKRYALRAVSLILKSDVLVQ